MTRYPGPGKYTFTVMVDDNNNKAAVVKSGPPTVVKPMKAGIMTCCGSRVPVPDERREAVGVFSRTVAGPVLVPWYWKRCQEQQTI